MKHVMYFVSFLTMISLGSYSQSVNFLPVLGPLPSSPSTDYVHSEAVKILADCDGHPVNSNYMRFHIDENIILPLDPIAAPIAGNYNINTSLSVGAIPGMADVSASGAANYNIPVFIPPGTAGMQPTISIVYNSQGGNGMLGMKWDIAGLSAITRTSQTIYHDNIPFFGPPRYSIAHGINLANTDAFALDGNRLIFDGPPNGGSTYHTEVESFSKIESLSASGTIVDATLIMPDNFKVTTKDGKILEYGNSADSKVLSFGLPQINGLPQIKNVAWRLNKVTDANGNYMKYYYKQFQGESWIEKIEYTGNDAAGINCYNTIKFIYETKSDKNISYIAGARNPQTLILKKIKSEAGGKVLRELDFDYSFNISTRLTSITEKGSDGTELNPTLVYWGDVTSPIDETPDALPGVAYYHSMFVGDFNGDGKRDVFSFALNGSSGAISISNGDGTFIMQPNPITFPALTFRPNLSVLGDFNADGIDDILLCFLTSLYGNSYTYYPIYGNPTLNFQFGAQFQLSHPSGVVFKTATVGDFNGDGTSDLLIERYESSSDETVFTITTNLSSSWSTYYPILNSIEGLKYYRIGDFNGNGKSDIMLVYNDAKANSLGYSCKILEINWTGIQIGANCIYSAGFPSEWHRVYTGDFNGDGKTDLLSYNNDHVWRINYSTGLQGCSNGNMFTIDYYPGSLFTGDQDDPTLACVISDYNGDGKDDILVNYDPDGDATTSNTLNIYYYVKPDYFIPEYHWVAGRIDRTVKQRHGDVTKCNTSGGALDFTGDGHADIIKYNPSYPFFSTLSFHKNEQKDFVQSITNGLNNTVSFTYSTLSEGALSQPFPLYIKGSGAIFPVVDYQGPSYVVSQMQTPDGIGGLITTKYTYDGLKIHLQGRGFLGFEHFTAENLTTGWKIKQKFGFLPDVFYPIPLETKTYKGGITTSSVDYAYKKIPTTSNSNTANSFFPYADWSMEYNGLTASYKTSTFVYNPPYEGNLTKLTEEFTDSPNTFPEMTRITNNSYTTKGGSGIPNKLEHSDVTTSYHNAPPITLTSDYFYDPATYNLNQQITGPGPKTVTTDFLEYDAVGQPHKVQVSSPGLPTSFTSYEYDSKFRFVVKTTNSLNDISYQTYNNDGTVQTQTDINNLSTIYSYNGFSELTKTYTPLQHTISTTSNRNTSSTHPNTLYSVTTSEEGSPTISSFYDALGRIVANESEALNGNMVVTEKQYNNKGQLFKESKPAFGSPAKWIEYHYDNFDRNNYIDDGNKIINIAHLGLKVTTSSPNDPSVFSEKTYNGLGNLKTATDNGGTIDYVYASNGQPATITTNGLTTTIHYDSYGVQDKLTDPDAGITDYDHNAYGQLTYQKDAKNEYKNFDYDVLGRLNSKTGNEGIYTYEYYLSGNGKRQLRKVTGPAPDYVTQEYTYDKYGRTISFTEKIPNDNKSFTTSYEYDQFSNLTKQTYPSGFFIENQYDNKGYLNEIKNSMGVAIWHLNNENSYGQPTSINLGSSITTTHVYDPNTDYLTNIITPGLQNLTYAFDQYRGNLNSRSNGSISEDFTPYDNLNRLKSIAINNGTPAITNFLTNGNIDFKPDVGNYAYGSPGPPHGVTTISANAGSISKFKQVIDYTPFSKVERISENNYVLDFTYGPDQQRIKTVLTHNGTIAKTKYFSADYEEVTIAGITQKIHYISGSDGLDAIYIDNGSTPQLYFVLKDNLGSITTLIDQSGNKEEYSYDAWGRRRDPLTGVCYTVSNTPNFLIDRGYTGHEHLDEFGLINMNGRFYDPILGRMLSPDNYVQAATSTQSYNRYSYCFNNPLKYTDPTGNYAFWDDLGVMAVGGLFNLGSNLISGNVQSWGEAGGYFLTGMLAAEASYYGGPMAGAAVLGAGNDITRQIATNGSGDIDLGQVAGSAGMSMLTSGLSNQISSSVSPYVSQAVSNVSRNTVVQNMLNEGITNGITAFGTSATVSFATGASFSDAMHGGFKEMQFGLGMGMVQGFFKASNTADFSKAKITTKKINKNYVNADLEINNDQQIIDAYNQFARMYGREEITKLPSKYCGFSGTLINGVNYVVSLNYGNDSNPTGWTIKAKTNSAPNLPQGQNFYLRLKKD